MRPRLAILALCVGCGGPADSPPAKPSPVPAAKVARAASGVVDNSVPRVSGGGKATTRTAKSIPLRSFESPEELCAKWPSIAAEESGLELENLEPIACKASTAKIPKAQAPIDEFRIYQLSADRISHKALLARVGNKWHWVVSLENQSEMNRSGDGEDVTGMFFQDLIPGGGSELVIRTTLSSWRLDHDDSEKVYESREHYLQVCRNADDGLRCAAAQIGASSNDIDLHDKPFEFTLEFAVDEKGRIHVSDPKGLDRPLGEKKQPLSGVFALGI